MAQLVARGAVVALPDAARASRGVRRHGARQRDHEADHQLGDRVRVFAGHVDDGDAARARGLHVDVVGAARPLRDQLELRRRVDHAPGDAVVGAGDEDLAVADDRRQLVR